MHKTVALGSESAGIGNAMSEEANSASDKPTNKKPVKGRGWVWLVALALIAIGAWYGFQRWEFDKKHVYTDNAQVQGRIVKILSPETGYIEKLAVSANQPVKNGELLVKLSDDFYRWEVQRAQAQLNIVQSRLGDSQDAGLAQAQLSTAKARQEVIESQLEQAKSATEKADAAYQRMKLQFDNDNVNQSQLDMAKASKDQADAYLLTVQKDAYVAQQEVIEAEASGKLVGFGLDSAKAELAQAQERLTYTSIKSPIDGVVAKLQAESGVLVEPGQYLMSVVSLSDVWVVANIKESDFLKVKHGASVSITIDAFPGETFEGVVRSTSPATGSMFSLIPKDNASGNFIKVSALIPVRIDFIGLPQATHRLLPGMSAEVQIAIIDKPIDVNKEDNAKSPAVALTKPASHNVDAKPSGSAGSSDKKTSSKMPEKVSENAANK